AFLVVGRPKRGPRSLPDRERHTMTLNGFIRRIGFLFTIAVGLAGQGCADKVATAISPCPCAAGYVCCSSGVCAPSEDSCGTAAAALSAAAHGRWTGYVENASFWSGSDAIDLSFSVDASGTLSGTVFVGHSMPPAPPTRSQQRLADRPSLRRRLRRGLPLSGSEHQVGIGAPQVPDRGARGVGGLVRAPDV